MESLIQKAKLVRKNILYLTNRAGKKGAHIGPSLSLVEILTVLFSQCFDFSKDKFVLSKGHGGLGYYASLYETGQITKEQLETFEQNGGDFPGQPSRQPGNSIIYSSGSLGLGLSYGAGLAWSMRRQEEDGRVVVLLGDGELNEGSVWESVMFAKQQELSNLLAIVDWNGMQSDGKTEQIISMDLEEIWRAFGWEVMVCDGHNTEELKRVFTCKENGKPRVILAKTTKGKGVSFMENDRRWHHGGLNEEQYEAALKEVEEADGI